MFKTKKLKLLIACACIIALILPYATPVLAVTGNDVYSQSDLKTLQTINLVNDRKFPHDSFYSIDNSNYSDHDMYHIYVKEENYYNEKNAIYCLNGEKRFPGHDSNKEDIITPYRYAGNFFDDSDKEETAEVRDYKNSINAQNYNSICWLANNMYLEYQDDEQHSKYDDFLNKIYGYWIESSQTAISNPSSRPTIEGIKNNLNLDDIKAIQQMAIWYFSNNTESFKYVEVKTNDVDVNTYPSGYCYVSNEISTKYELPVINVQRLVEGSNSSQPDLSYNTNTKKTILNMMFSYLVVNAQKNNSSNVNSIQYPNLETTDSTVTVENTNYKIGPFKISNATADTNAEHYEIVLTDGTNKITNITLKEKENGTTINSLQYTVGKTFYVYVPIPENGSLSGVRLGIEYKDQTTEASLWKKVDDTANEYQPLIWITKNNPVPVYKEVPIEKSDLALRKYIVSVNGDETVARKPKVYAKGLLENNPNKTTAEYKHKKSPIEVSVGDKIVYELRVYNEGKTSAQPTEITDFIPAGLKLATNSTINTTYGWTPATDGITKTTNLNKVLNPVDASTVNSQEGTLTGGLDTTYVQIELEVEDSAAPATVLTNVAEITADNIVDRDSGFINISKGIIDESTFSGNRDNQPELNDDEYFYKGLEDDDDFEKVKIKGKVFDLALQKFITKVNGKNESREPKVDVSSLATTTNATYTTTKSPVVVKQGDIVTYKIRVYNEGDLDGYAEEIADYIPDGLGWLMTHNVNVDNSWSVVTTPGDGSKVIELGSIPNAINNLKLEDFNGATKLEEIPVITGPAKIKTKNLSSDKTDTLIEKFDIENDTTLHYKDVEIVCVVVADEVKGNNLKNIAEIVDDKTVNSNNEVVEVDDRDSIPDTVNPNNYPECEKQTNNGNPQDDHDYEDLVMNKYQFDLALQKFITAVDDEQIKNRAPVLTTENGKIKYNHTTDPLSVGNGDLVEYTIRVYNEGNQAGYAAEIADDLPKGLKYVVDNETNKKYGWQLVDKFGAVTTDINQAVTVRTKYLSKEESEKRKEDCLLKPFDSTKPISTDSNNPNPDYKDVKIVFEVEEKILEATKTTEKRIIKNTAEITDDTDENGNEVIDEDSTPDNWKEGEDDIDYERIYVKYFDLALKKDLIKVIVIEDGKTIEYNVSEDQLFKVEINKKKIKSTVVKFVYNITIKNEGEIAGYAKEIKDYIPEGLEFVSDDNKGWYKLSDKVIGTDALAKTLLQPGETGSVQVTLKWINGENNLGKKINVAEISKDENEYDTPDVDSTPDNQVPGEDDIDDAPVILSISTGKSQTNYTLFIAVTAIMTTGIVLIKKYVI